LPRSLLICLGGIYDPSFANVIGNIHLFAAAQLSYQVVTEAVFTNIFPKIPFRASFEVPALEANFDSMSEDLRAELRGFGMAEATATKFQGSPDSISFGKILRMGPNDKRITPGFVSINAYYAYIQCIRGMALYQYMANNVAQNDPKIRLLKTRLETIKVGSSVNIGNWGDRSVIENYDLSAAVTSGPNEIVCFDATGTLAYPYDKSRSIVTNFLTPADGITNNGLYFAYFRGMNLPDRSFAATIFQRIFFKGLGPDPLSAAGSFGRIREGLRQLSHFPAGLAITHAYLGISLSENAQVPIRFVISDGVYRGFVLTGNFSVIYRNVLYSPESPMEVTTQIQQLNAHGLTLGILVVRLNAATKADGTAFPILDVTSINTSRKLLNAINARRNTGTISEAEWDGIFDLVKDLRFSDHFKPYTPTDILNFLKYVRGDDAAISNYPAYLHGNYARDTSRLSIGLGIFGPTAPSVSFDHKGRTFTIPDSASNDPNLSEVNKKRVLQFIPIETLPVINARERWSTIISKGEFRFPNPSKNKASSFVERKHYNIAISGTDFGPTYDLIKSLVSSARSNAQAGKKRKAVDADEVAGEVKRKKVLSAAADLI